MKIDLERLTRFYYQRGNVILLESQSDEHPWSQKSYLAAEPQAVIKAWGDHITIWNEGEKIQKKEDPWSALQQFRSEQENWMFGYLGYDLKNHIEDLDSTNRDEIKAPDLYFMSPGLLLEVDHKTDKVQILRGVLPEDFGQGDCTECKGSFDLQNFRSTLSEEDYLSHICQAQHEIAEGNYYEINLSHQMKGDFWGDPLTLYHQMKKVGPVPFGAFMQNDDWTICCQSPERFMRKEGDTVFSQPIKGTAERGDDLGSDKVLKEQLLSSAKERAENLMIVDLVRNDLSRIAKEGSVNVPQLFSVESFGTVHQMVSTITAQARAEDPVNILKACFPMGSMTGAPKISAMKAIEKFENYRRGIYSGAIGYITDSGDFDFNVVIRTAILQQGQLYYSVGGAITSDSDPQKEWQETQVKARALVEALAK